MKKALILAALVGLGVAACGGDDGDKDNSGDKGGNKADAGGNKGDSGAVSRGQQVDTDKLGKECSSDTECQGTAKTATCLKTQTLMGATTTYEGGYCSASCQASAECGPNGGCPAADVLAGIPIPGFSITTVGGFVPVNCYEKCTKQDDCRAGYICKSLNDLASSFGGDTGGTGLDIGSLLGSLPGAGQTYCWPPLPERDAGVVGGKPDAGTTTTVGGMDAGV